MESSSMLRQESSIGARAGPEVGLLRGQASRGAGLMLGRGMGARRTGRRYHAWDRLDLGDERCALLGRRRLACDAREERSHRPSGACRFSLAQVVGGAASIRWFNSLINLLEIQNGFAARLGRGVYSPGRRAEGRHDLRSLNFTIRPPLSPYLRLMTKDK